MEFIRIADVSIQILKMQTATSIKDGKRVLEETEVFGGSLT